MATDMKTYEVAIMVADPGEELDLILSENEDDPDFTLSKGLLKLSERMQAAAEYYLLLSQKLGEATHPVDVYCDSMTIEIDGGCSVFDELVDSGHLNIIPEDEDDFIESNTFEEELEDKVLYADSRYDFAEFGPASDELDPTNKDYEWKDEYTDFLNSYEEEEYPYDFNQEDE